MKLKYIAAQLSFALSAMFAPTVGAQIDRTVLPVPEPQPATITELDVRNAKAPPRFEVKAPQGAPNVVIVLLDDVGFGQPSTFGGPCKMPTLDKLAADGLRYNYFHTTALCSPTRTALLTGRNHHVNNAGAIMEVATAFPGYTGIRPQSVAPLAEMLRLNGYSTAAFGKYHETPPWEVSVSGPFDRWPTHSGFDKFYGFIGGETNQWAPAIFDGTIRVEPPHDPAYHFTVDMTNQAIAWMQAQHSLTPDKPFFVYFATGAAHAPHHVPKEYIDRYKGKFDQGWDALHEEIFSRQKQIGVIPATAELTKRPKEIPSWDSQTPDQMDESTFDNTLAVDLKGVFLCMKHEIAHMVQSGSGTIVNNASIAGLIAEPGISAYMAAKHGVVGLSKAAAFEYAKQGIRINALAPGLVNTAMTKAWFDDPDMSVHFIANTPIGRVSQPAEIAGMVLFLCSDFASFAVGQTFVIDGGYTTH
jgi:NAD(P)-dependent dehydrogenase (short-subunit alcohol dehydrogenase family)